MTEVTIYTDGACSKNPGPGGWGAILIYNGHEKELCGYEADTTNNRMELLSVISALKALKRPCGVNLYTDSKYVASAFNEGWIYNWNKNGWQTAAKNPVANQDLWQELLTLTRTHKVVFNWVKGHSTNDFNNRCDRLAQGQVKQLIAKTTMGG